VLILGTGGVSRAVVWALLSINHQEIYITGRSQNKLLSLVADVGVPNVNPVMWKKRNDFLVDSTLIINATSAGMTGKPALNVELSKCSNKTFVYDLVYTPTETELIKQAEELGCKTLGGLDMLIAQARPSFRLFYNQDPPENINIREKLIKALEERL